MTKKLEDLLGLPESKKSKIDKKIEKPSVEAEIENQQKTFIEIAEIDKIASALPTVKGLGELSDNELNEVAEKAMEAYDDLFTLGMNVEARYAGRIFEVAGNMLRTNLDAKIAKIDKKLKTVELQLKKQKLDSEQPDAANFTEGEGYIVADRNSLMERLKGLDKDKQ